jgi:hypothetical protein
VAKYGSVEAFKTVRKKINGLRNYALNIIYNYFLFNKIIFLSLPGFGIPDSARLHPGYLLSKDLKCVFLRVLHVSAVKYFLKNEGTENVTHDFLSDTG